MTIKTLTHIHNLLKEEKDKQYNAYAYIRDCTTTAYCDKKPNADYLKEQKDKTWNKYIEAKHALEDFEEQEF